MNIRSILSSPLSPPGDEATDVAKIPYAELHAHTNFSFLDGASTADDLVERAVARGLSGLAATDRNVLAGFYEGSEGGPAVAFCFGDGSGAVCPCANNGLPGHGCQNSDFTGGAVLAASGIAALANDTLVLTSSGERPTALTVFLQGSLEIAPVLYGDGLRCAGGSLKRLFNHNAVGGTVSVKVEVYGERPDSALAADSSDGVAEPRTITALSIRARTTATSRP